MTMFFYLLMLLSGFVIAFMACRHHYRLRQQQRIIAGVEKDRQHVRQSTIDVDNILIDNSSWLSLLKQLDTQLSVKMGTLVCVMAIISLTEQIGLFTLSAQDLVMVMLLLLVLIIVIPGLLQKPAITQRYKLMMDALPYFVDLLAVCIQAGMTVENAIKFITHNGEEIDANLSSLMRLLTKRADVSGMEEALGELYRMVDKTEMRMFCATLQQSVHYGTSLYDNLIELSRDIRELQLLSAEEKVGKLSARMSIPLILFIMFPITILIAAPGVLRIMKNALF